MIIEPLKSLFSLTILVIAVMLAARLVGAKRKDFWAASISVILQIALVFALVAILPSTRVPANSPLLILAVIGGSLIHSIVLKTTLLRGFLIGIIAICVAAILQFTILAGTYAAIGVAT
jgi:hypothetical protein